MHLYPIAGAVRLESESVDDAVYRPPGDAVRIAARRSFWAE
jgi:hypothetical protein